MRWTLVCIFRTPDNPCEATRAAASQLNQITAALSYSSQPLTRKLFALVKYVFFFVVFFAAFLLCATSGRWAPVMKWVNDLEGAWWGRGVDWGRRENDQHWFILDVLLSGWCRSQHLAASHSLPLSPRAHRSPMSFLQGHKYFHQTPYCSHIIPPNAT